MKLHNPLPESVELSCKKAASILEHFIKGHNELDSKLIPQSVLKKASGGAQFGLQQTDVVFVLNNRNAVKAFSHGNITIGGNVSVAAGPTGRSSEAGGAVVHPAPIYSYSKSKGMFVGVTLEGTLILTRKKTNEAFYGPGVTARDLLGGTVRPPPVADPLYRMLDIKFGHMPSSSALSNGLYASLENESGWQDIPPRDSETSQTTMGRASSVCETAKPAAYLPASHTLPRASAATKPTPPPKPRSKPRKCTALYDYRSGVDGDLSFSKGDVIWISGEKGEWFEGTLAGQKGLFPANHVAAE
ncbi:hypothetical protein HDV03_003827 [Kappamyces sp. JEL0829]|nr:hypothetical protein HDV03_003827 [Kappamyces sp. JEL0829]